jgi:hypothetical protein
VNKWTSADLYSFKKEWRMLIRVTLNLLSER